MTSSPNGVNKFLVRGFKNRQKLMNHWEEHGSQYYGLTYEEYEVAALKLIESAVNEEILGHTDKDEAIVRYNKRTNDFVKGKVTKGIFTMFKPNEGLNYYLAQKKEDLKHGGRE
ncbi:MAG: hypothetical protein IKN43_15375 [Selenomonadaceae bacterium]|nr:hypothetical protein [Selenomonadaceae bacterium]